MAKTTRSGGDSYTPEEMNDPVPPARIQRAMLGEVDRPSAGNSSEVSSGKERKPKESETVSDPSPAPAENPSVAPVQETPFTVHTTVSDGPKTTQQQSAKRPPAKKTTKPRATVLDDKEFDEF